MRLSLYFLFTGKEGLGARVGGFWVDGCWEHVGLSCAPGEMSVCETSSWEQQIEVPVLQTGTALRHDASPRHQKCTDRLLGGRERQRELGRAAFLPSTGKDHGMLSKDILLEMTQQSHP